MIVIHLIQISEGFYYLDTVLGKYCGNTSPPPVISRTNIVYVWWKTNDYLAGKGFVLKYRSGKCDPIHAGIQKVLSGRGGPNLTLFLVDEWREDANTTISEPSSARQWVCR